jgi:phosphoglycolate phosphatase-like HAD superfamily hydrolase
VPAQWTWRKGRITPGPTVVVDIDGVLSDAARRQHYLEATRPDWRAFFEACGDDELIEEIKILLDLLDPALSVVLLTGRPGRVRHLTQAWLDRYGIRWDVLLMREGGDYSMAREFKEEAVAELRKLGFDLRLAFEDDRRNAEMFRDAGVPCVYIHSGYYD